VAALPNFAGETSRRRETVRDWGRPALRSPPCYAHRLATAVADGKDSAGRAPEPGRERQPAELARQGSPGFLFLNFYFNAKFNG
jgi:hypothetical protein